MFRSFAIEGRQKRNQPHRLSAHSLRRKERKARRSRTAISQKRGKEKKKKDVQADRLLLNFFFNAGEKVRAASRKTHCILSQCGERKKKRDRNFDCGHLLLLQEGGEAARPSAPVGALRWGQKGGKKGRIGNGLPGYAEAALITPLFFPPGGKEGGKKGRKCKTPHEIHARLRGEEKGRKGRAVRGSRSLSILSLMSPETEKGDLDHHHKKKKWGGGRMLLEF